MGIEALIAGGATGLGLFNSAYAASEQNKAIKKAQQSTIDAANVQIGQVQNQAALERQKRFNESQAIRSRIRVAAGESGIGMGGSYEALMRQADFDEATNKEIINQNASMNINRVVSGTNADLVSLQNKIESPLLQGIMGGLTGLQSGLAIDDGINRISAANDRKQLAKQHAQDQSYDDFF